MGYFSEVRAPLKPGHYDVSFREAGLGWEDDDGKVRLVFMLKQSPTENPTPRPTPVVLVLELFQARDMLNALLGSGVVAVVQERLGLGPARRPPPKEAQQPADWSKLPGQPAAGEGEANANETREQGRPRQGT
ncbi:MAG: hypothetical protein KGJ23_07780 [Euryarchaeota archaeon]|nr:hypothetical protein [Euryarchaeota archaeon]MDE1836499.1 hypothetical protein [Euryarchaeota archaeon]MDE1879306.1 hypothetical protein [Euryarchaeota archaeon]MDE2044469.1 hypothetical protein [Thermoplasmata archaeon]